MINKNDIRVGAVLCSRFTTEFRIILKINEINYNNDVFTYDCLGKNNKLFISVTSWFHVWNIVC